MEVIYYRGAAVLYCMNEEEYGNLKCSEVPHSALLCAKNPFHKQIVGYEKNCPKEHKNYLYAYSDDGNALALNMIDAKDKKYFSDKMILEGLDFIEHELNKGNSVVVVCNQGESRSPTMCLLYLMLHGDFEKTMTHSEIFTRFKEMCPCWKPNKGISDYTIDFWDRIRKGEKFENLC